MPGASKAFVRRVAGLLTLAVVSILGRLSLLTARSLARRLAGIAFHLVPRLSKVALNNLDLAYGDSISPADKRRIAREAVENLFYVAFEFPFIARLNKDMIGTHVHLEGFDRVDFNRGVMLIGAHLGNWEWMIPALHYSGHKIACVVRAFDDPPLQAYVDSTRRAGGMHPIVKERASAEIMQKLRDGWIVGVLIDQSPRENAVPTTFFGQSTWGTIAPVMAAIRAKVPVHPASMRRNADGSYVMEFHEAIQFVRTGNLHNDLVENTQRCQAVIEAEIRRAPGQWLWVHRRWKSRPRLEAEWNARVKRDVRKQDECEAKGSVS